MCAARNTFVARFQSLTSCVIETTTLPVTIVVVPQCAGSALSKVLSGLRHLHVHGHAACDMCIGMCGKTCVCRDAYAHAFWACAWKFASMSASTFVWTRIKTYAWTCIQTGGQTYACVQTRAVENGYRHSVQGLRSGLCELKLCAWACVQTQLQACT